MENLATLRIVMLPWLAHGHISPYLELAKKLATRFEIYMCSTPATLISVRSKLAEKFTDKIHLIDLHLRSSAELPPRYHTTNGLPPHLMSTLKDTFDKAIENFENILKKVNPDLLIYDILQPWAPALASIYGIPAVQFISCSATMTAYGYHFLTIPETKFPYEKTIFYRDYESDLAKRLVVHDKDTGRVIQCMQRSNEIVLIKSFAEIEGKYSDYLSALTGKKVVPVGHLVQDPIHDDQDGEIMQWLDEKEKGSTIFVSFGSEYFLCEEDLEEIARGLELCGVNFIWVVRFPKGKKEGTAKMEDVLPKGFLERVGGRGKVVDGWAPQSKILTHPSVGGFVSHCGWNSVLEAMKFGVPIIAMPMNLDQPVNARLIGDVGNGIEVLRDSSKRLHRETIAETINKVVKGEGGEKVREKARQLKAVMEAKGDEEIDVVVEELEWLYVKNLKNNLMMGRQVNKSVGLLRHLRIGIII